MKILVLVGVMIMLNLSPVAARVVIEPNPNKEVGLMASDSKYFNCKTDNARQGWCFTRVSRDSSSRASQMLVNFR